VPGFSECAVEMFPWSGVQDAPTLAFVVPLLRIILPKTIPRICRELLPPIRRSVLNRHCLPVILARLLRLAVFRCRP